MAKSQHGGSRPGSGRKVANPEGKVVVVAASVPEALVAKLDDLAAQKSWNRSQAVTEAIRRLVKAKQKA
jgi:metal-responsive CopG/Arc/MetJ family transcriptional regulator